MDVAKVKRAQAIARGWLARKAFARRKKRARHRTHVCKELLDTEQTYVRSLKTLQQAYLDPLRRINPELASSIASNLQQIIELHSMLLGQLEARISAWTYHSRIADIFMQYAPFFKMYTEYTMNYERALQQVEEARASSSEVKECLSWNPEKQNSGVGIHAVQAIESYLIMPVQRLPRYRLLLEDLLLHTEPDHPDHAGLCGALKRVEEANTHVEKMLQSQVKRNRLLEFHQQTGGEAADLFQPWRTWRGEFHARRLLLVGSVPVWFVVTDDILIMASQLLVSYRYQEHFPLHLLFLTSLPDGFIFQNVLRVTCGESEHALSFATPEDRQAALTLVQSALDDLLASQPALREARDRARAALEGTSTPAAVSASVSATPASSGPTPAQPAPQVPAPAPVSVSASAPAASPLTTSGSADATKPGPPPGLSAREKRDTLSLGSGNVLRKAQTQTAPSAEADNRVLRAILRGQARMSSMDEQRFETLHSLSVAERRALFENGVLPQSGSALSSSRLAIEQETKAIHKGFAREVIARIQQEIAREAEQAQRSASPRRTPRTPSSRIEPSASLESPARSRAFSRENLARTPRAVQPTLPSLPAQQQQQPQQPPPPPASASSQTGGSSRGNTPRTAPPDAAPPASSSARAVSPSRSARQAPPNDTSVIAKGTVARTREVYENAGAGGTTERVPLLDNKGKPSRSCTACVIT